MKLAIVHDYLREYGGAERVVEVMHEMWPDAPLYTSFVDWERLGDHAERFKNWDIRTSWVQHNPLVKKFHSPLRFLAPWIWGSIDLSSYDVVISSSGWYMCRGVKTKPNTGTGRQKDSQNSGAVHFCYIHHPPRNLYGYATGSTLQKYWLVRVYAGIINFFLRHYDFETAQQVDYFIANSQETARRVTKFYRRDSTVIYPPIEIAHQSVKVSQPKSNKEKYFLVVGRLTYSKQVNIIIQACNTLKLPLKIVGVGKELESLQALAGPTIEFVGGVSDERLAELYAGAQALIFCALEEDFGMVPVEAMGHGVPVIGLAQGGVKETVIDGKTGILFPEPTVDSLLQAIHTFQKESKDWSTMCRRHADTFSKERFVRELRSFVEKLSRQSK